MLNKIEVVILKNSEILLFVERFLVIMFLSLL